MEKEPNVIITFHPILFQYMYQDHELYSWQLVDIGEAHLAFLPNVGDELNLAFYELLVKDFGTSRFKVIEIRRYFPTNEKDTIEAVLLVIPQLNLAI